jgi:hypothetical protein
MFAKKERCLTVSVAAPKREPARCAISMSVKPYRYPFSRRYFEKEGPISSFLSCKTTQTSCEDK